MMILQSFSVELDGGTEPTYLMHLVTGIVLHGLSFWGLFLWILGTWSLELGLRFSLSISDDR